MAVKTIFKCPCGQETHLVQTAEGWRYDEKIHGNGELAHGKCFNCRKTLTEFETEKPQAVDETVDDTIEEVVDDVVNLEKMSKKELHELAEQLQIEVPKNLGKKKLIKRIEEFRAANAEASEDVTED